ncbi:MAG: hypothetical protein EOL88_00940 [Bacteroidia bacterium]|nr:hypothetical protein [Bacteroidia bacterium]
MTTNLWLHLGYHKCMTVLFHTVFGALAQKISGFHEHYNEDIISFMNNIEQPKEFSFVHLGLDHVVMDFSLMPTYKGTHIVRDPRDLLVSGYRYHLWSTEKWLNKVLGDWFLKERLRLQDLGLLEYGRGKSFKEILSSVDKETGLIIELNWRQKQFDQMASWDYSNPNILEIRYENVFGKELEVFERIFNFLGLEKIHMSSALEIVDSRSFYSLQKQRKTGPQKHASVGVSEQWQSFLPNKVIDHFNESNSKLLDILGYNK